MPLYTHGDHSKGGTVEQLTELEQRNINTALETLRELWRDVKVNNIPMETRSIPCEFDEHSTFIKSVLKYRQHPSSLNASDIFKYLTLFAFTVIVTHT